jgi:hypothetical protein
MEEEKWGLIFINAMLGAPGASLIDLLKHCPIDKIKANRSSFLA